MTGAKYEVHIQTKKTLFNCSVNFQQFFYERLKKEVWLSMIHDIMIYSTGIRQ